MKIASVLFLGFFLWASPATAQNSSETPETESLAAAAAAAKRGNVNPAKEADIRRLLAVTGATNMATQMMDTAEKNIKPLLTASFPPGEYREKLIDLFFAKFHSKIDMQRFLDLAVPVYDKYLSDEEIKGLTQFYETPLGRKTLTVLPQLMADLQAAGQKWGEGIGRQSMVEVLAEHPELEEALKEAKKTKQE
ncbi:MAG TPA: DUF2059 domain-containing protein [Terriglobales bacterium]|nr:DUF2059 domain-containing protein [Terriglobales bacterium]